jgi:hypothetical protein
MLNINDLFLKRQKTLTIRNIFPVPVPMLYKFIHNIHMLIYLSLWH